MDRFTHLPRRGDFAGQVLTGAFDPVWEDGSHRASYFGLTLEGSWPYAVVTAPASGTTYALHRNVQGRTTRGVLIQRNRDGAMRVMPESFRAASGGTVKRALTNDGDLYEGGPFPGGPSFRFLSGPHVDWEESDGERTFLRLSGDLAGPGFHVHAPWREGDELGGVYYTSLCWRVGGEMFGEEVTGFALLDQSYLPHGVYWNDSPVWNRYQVIWSVFANAFEDGSVEFGHFSVGADNFRFGVVSDVNGPVLDVRDDVEAEVTFGEDEFAQQVRYRIGDTRWVYEHAPDGSMVDASTARPGWKGHVGTILREDETRTPVAGFGWQEIFPDRL